MAEGRASPGQAPAPADDADGRALHARLVAGDRTASAELAVRYLDELVAWLRRTNPRADPDDCVTAAGEALLDLICRPRSYDPARQTLAVYLRVSARGDLRNLQRAERKHASRRAPLEVVELPGAAGKYPVGLSEDPADVVERREQIKAHLSPVPAAVADGLTPQEARVLELMRAGERKTALFAVALGITGLPVAEQRRAVKRAKDRLVKRLERAGNGGG